MLRFRSLPLFFSAVVTLGAALLLSCAAPPAERQAPKPPKVSISDVKAAFQEAETAFQNKDYEHAREVYSALAANPQGLSEEQVQTVKNRLGRIDSILHERRLSQTRQRAQALLAEAESLVQAKKYDQASEKLVALRGLEQGLNAEQAAKFQGLCDAVREATGVPPGASEAQARQQAERLFALGMSAYEKKDYARAKKLLDKVAASGVSLGWLDNRRLRKTRERVDEALKKLRSDYERAVELAKAGKLAEAEKLLVEIRDSGITFGADEEGAALLGEVRAKIEQQQRQESAERAKAAAALLAEAAGLSQKGDYAGAVAKLDALKPLEKFLSPEQRDQAAALREATTAAAEAQSLRRQQEEAERLAQQAAELVETRKAVMSKVQAAETAWQQGQFEKARELFTQADQALSKLDLSRLPALQDAARTVRQRLAVVDARIELAASVREAARLASADLLAAEKKVAEIRQSAARRGLQLSESENRVLDGILAQVDRKYGPVRRLRSQVIQSLLQKSQSYAAAGEWAKAAATVELLEQVGRGVLNKDALGQASRELAAAKAHLREQQATLASLDEQVKQARASVRQGRPATALETISLVLDAAARQRLAGPKPVELLKSCVELLEKDIQPALKDAAPDMGVLVDAALARAQVELARRLSTYYLENNSPELAEPYLEKLAEGKGGASRYAGWAKQVLGGIEQLKAAAEKQRLLAVKDEAQEVYELATKLRDLAGSGALAKAEAVRKQLADARLRLAAAKALAAVRRGAYTEADALLKQAPLQDASRAAVSDHYQPVAAKLKKLGQAAANLQAAQDAMAKHDLQAALERLQAAQQAGIDAMPEAAPLVMKKEALATIVDSAREALATYQEMQSKASAALQNARARLQQLNAREEAWQAYFAAIKAFLLDQPDAVARLQTVLGRSAALRDWEVADARAALKALGPAAPAPAVAQDEQKARDLYEEAVRAYEAGNAERVRVLLNELKTKYAHTKVYREHL